jgi:hypothetical protein
LDDLIIGAFGADVCGKSNAGKSYVIFGKKDSTTPLITNPPVPLVIAESSITVPSVLPKITWDFPAHDSASIEPTIKSSKPAPSISPVVETGKPLSSPPFSPLITNPPVHLAIAAPTQVMSTVMACMVRLLVLGKPIQMVK